MKIKAPVKRPVSSKSDQLQNNSGLSSRDFVSGQEIRWCPGCGDYSILKQMQTILPQTGIEKKDLVFVSGIGCSSRFPYYLDTFGMHSIHGRATAIASGLTATRPELSVWIVTGDGVGLSIGGNHMAHLLRRNFDVNVLLFNNEIYGLTKGQYSPTSKADSITKSTPLGSLDHPFNPSAFAMGAEGTFIARSIDRDPKHLQAMLKRTHEHKGTSFLEIYQNCNIFNDGAFLSYTEKDKKKQHTLFVEHGKPMVFGNEDEYGIKLEGTKPVLVELSEGASLEDLWIHDENDAIKANILIRMESLFSNQNFPRPFGVLYLEKRSRYEDLLEEQITNAIAQKGKGDLDALIAGNETWVID
ncbi:MAG: 2-oxoacid:ferredoxin oxidoreductase subunit beta [Cyclobacteriaceae bacterium]|nr:2-oxoacid:ferredoxin oxidoreductase subunit beta [Cyclobacteriaceae bacterium]